MNNIRRGILILVKSAITGEKYLLPQDFSLEEAFSIVKQRNIIPLVYTGALFCGIPKQDPIMLRMLQSTFRAIIHSEQQMSDLSRILEAFDNNKIDYLPIKGAHMKSLYPKPELRTMGDADILIRSEQYEQIIPILKEQGFKHNLDSDHHFVWYTEHLTLELHQKLVSSYYIYYSKYYADGWWFANLDYGTRYKFRSAEDEFIYLFIHFTKHYLYGGIGCRHVIDLWVFRYKHPTLNEDYILSQMHQLHLEEFYQNMLQVINAWFEDGFFDEKVSFITDFIFASGNWGSIKTKVLSTSVQELQKNKYSKFYRIRKYMKILFPPKETLALRYEFLRKHPSFSPFFYPIRIIDTLLTRQKNVRRHLLDISYSTSDNVHSYEQALNYVGLRFYY